MKRLLAYLFLVLGLGLLFSVNAFAGYKPKIKEQNTHGSVITIRGPFAVDKSSKWFRAFEKANEISIQHCKTMKKNTYVFWSQKSGIFARNSSGNLLSWISYSNDSEDFKYGFIQDYDEGTVASPYRFRYFCAKDEKKAYEIFKSYYKHFKTEFVSNITNISNPYYSELNTDPYKFKKLIENKVVKKTKPKKKKSEPKKKQEVVAKKKLMPDISGYDQWIQNSIEGKCGIQKRHFGPAAYIKCLNEEISGLSKLSSMPGITNLEKWIQESIEGKCGIQKRHFGPVAYIKCLNDEVSSLKLNTTTINIATRKEIKKVEVAETTQEEFKSEDKDMDNDAPIIEIAEAITVNDSTYEIEGKVIDKSKKLFIEIEGEIIPVKKGKFKIKRFSPVDEQIKIVAIDQWGNKSKPKLVNITIDIQETEVVEKLEPLNPSIIKSKSNKNRVALIIGIEKYEQTPAANFANLDAKYFYEYARKGFGISKSNIKLLVDEDANLIQSLGTLNKWLPGKIKKNQTELIIFFAGHGLASSDGKELFLLSQDSDPDLLSITALSRTKLFKTIIDLKPKSVTMFLDTCYSGVSRDEQMLLASARPIRIVADEQEGIPDNFTIFSATELDQISSGLKEAKHGIFSYYLMKGLEGKADSNKDKQITNGELLAYMDLNVSQKASALGRQQNPSLAGDPDKILMSYR